MLLLAFLAAPIIFYLLPAVLRLWKPFLIVWTVLGVLLAMDWISSYFFPVQQDPLGQAIGDALRAFGSICWLLAGIVQTVRGWAHARGNRNYRHWFGVLLGGAVSVGIGMFVF